MRENEIDDKGLDKGIYSKKFEMNYYNSLYSFGEALNNITTHIVNGNRAVTEYISCSKDFIIDLEKYAIEQLDLRPYLAIVYNHDESMIDSIVYESIKEKIDLFNRIYNRTINCGLTVEDYKKSIAQDEVLSMIYKELDEDNGWLNTIINSNIALYVSYPKSKLLNCITMMKQSDVKKMVIDASNNIYNDKTYKMFFDAGIIYNKNGERKTCFNQWEYGTARNSSEVIVLNHIASQDIQILNPLQYDVLYTLLNSFSLYSITLEVIQMLDIFKEENYPTIRCLFQNKYELLVFDCMYVNRMSILNMAYTKTLFKNIIYYKELVLQKCIQYLNHVLSKKYNDKAIFCLESCINLYDSSVVQLQGEKILKKDS